MKQITFFISTLFALSTGVNAQNSSPYWSLNGNSNVNSRSKLGTTNNYSLRFYTNNVPRMIINSAAGYVGIGTTAPTERLHVNSAAGANALRVQVGGSTKFLVHGEGGVSIGTYTNAPANGLYVAGNVTIGSEEVDQNENSMRASLEVTGSASIANGLRVKDFGIVGLNPDGYGVVGSSRGPAGVYGQSLVDGVVGDAAGYGVYGSGGSRGVGGYSTEGYGGYFTSDSSYGIVAATTPRGYYAGVFYGNIYSSGTLYQSSDKNLKTNIQEFGNAMSIINKLKPKNYEFKKDSKLSSLNLPAGSHYGLLAQDLQEVLPNLVSETPHELRIIKQTAKPAIAKSATYNKPAHVISDEKETKEIIKIKGVNYLELIPILVKGMQELSKENEDLKNQITDLKSIVTKNSNNSTIAFYKGYIKQNVPNPSNNSTIINYYIPNDTRKAQILVTDMKGSVLKAYHISSGEGQVNIANAEFPAGAYNYTLYINNNKIDTKKMVIIK